MVPFPDNRLKKTSLSIPVATQNFMPSGVLILPRIRPDGAGHSQVLWLTGESQNLRLSTRACLQILLACMHRIDVLLSAGEIRTPLSPPPLRHWVMR